MVIIITYYMKDRYYNHLSFKYPKIAKKFLMVLKERGATNIKVREI